MLSMTHIGIPEVCIRSTRHTYRQICFTFTVAFPVSSSTATMLRSPLATAHVAVAQVRGASTYRALGKKDSLVEKTDFKIGLTVQE
jgi:hypothetical protein